MSIWEIAKASDDLQKRALKFCQQFDNLIKLFGKQCGDDEDFQKLGYYWTVAKKAAGVMGCAVQIAERINLYREDILAERVQKLYEEDYSVHIIKNTTASTRNLINSLITTFRLAWDKSGEQDRENIKKCFIGMAELTPAILSLDKQINQ